MKALLACSFVAACGGDGSSPAIPDTALPDDDAAVPDDAPVDAAVSPVGTVTNVRDLATCPQGAPARASCKQVTVSGCPMIETEAIDAIVAIRPQVGTLRGTVVHFSGGSGVGFQGAGNTDEPDAGFQTVHVAWRSDWEQTQSLGIKAAGCRPATILRWIFDEPTIHAGSRTIGFCGEGFSAGAGQLGYSLAHYGLADYLDYVNELSGPPFARIDLGCDGDAPATADVCGTPNTMKLPDKVTGWENIAAPLQCGSTNVPAAELARWQADSIAIGGTYSYPQTQVQFFACTNNATAVTAQGRIYFDQIATAAGGNPALAQYRCYTAADGCDGEGLGTGNRDATQALLDNCSPRH